MSQTVVADVLVYLHVIRDEDEDLKYTKLDDGFHALLGSVDGVSTIRTLVENRQVFCLRTVKNVVLVKPEDTAQTLCQTFIMIITSPRHIDELSLSGKESAAR